MSITNRFNCVQGLHDWDSGGWQFNRDRTFAVRWHSCRWCNEVIAKETQEAG